MADQIFTIGFLENFKVFIVGILIYAVIYAILKKIDIFGDEKVNAFIALISAVIVSFSGVVTYAVTYAINWFVILLFIVVLMLAILMFLGIKPDQVAKTASSNSKYILIAFGILFAIILLKSFFALNNTFDSNNPQNDSYEINTQYNTGFDDIKENPEKSFLDRINIDQDLLYAALFLAMLGAVVFFIG